MLSKSQARLFFIAATAGFSGVFLVLTVDTLIRVPERSNEHLMSESVVRGKDIWDTNNCMGCHTILGEGAYYAPELTKVVERRGEAWINVFLDDPAAMYPGQRKMVKYDFTDEEKQDVIAFLKWVGEIDTNGFPPKPDLVPPTPVLATMAAAAEASNAPRPAIFDQLCTACHSLGGKGGNVGPALDDAFQRYDEAAMRAWLTDPQTVKPGTAMPKLPLTDSQLDELITFLVTSRR